MQRFNAFLKRNRGAVFSGFVKQLLVRIWCKFRLWRLVRPVIKAREPEAWVFMGGCYNSGTTILREMIGAHPDVSSLPREGVEMTDAFPELEAGGWVRMWYRNSRLTDLTDQNAHQLALRAKRDWAFWWSKTAKVFLEKSIVHGAWMPFLQEGFPNAKFIGVVRNGYCACEGIRRRANPDGEARNILGMDQYPIEEAGRQWVYANEVLLSDSQELKSYLQIQYETFADDPICTIRRVFHFIGLNPDVVIINTDGSISIGKRRFNVRNQNRESLARLNSAEVEALGKVINPMMERLGYDSGNNSCE